MARMRRVRPPGDPPGSRLPRDVIPAVGDLPDPRLADMGDAGDYWVLTGLRVPLAGNEYSDATV